MTKNDMQSQQTLKEVGNENLHPRFTPAATPHGHHRNKAMDFPAWRDQTVIPSPQSQSQSQYAAQYASQPTPYPQLLYTQPTPSPTPSPHLHAYAYPPTLQSPHSHSHPPRLTPFAITPNPEHRSRTAPPPPPPPYTNQRAESLKTLALTPHATPDDGVNIILPVAGSGGNALVFTVHRELLTHFSPVFKGALGGLDGGLDGDGDGGCVVKRLRVRRGEWRNELDWEDDDDDVGAGVGDEEGEGVKREEEEKERGNEQGKEEEEIELDIVIRLPTPRAGFPRLPLPPQAGDTTKEAFGAFVEWLYCGGGNRITTSTSTTPTFPPPNSHISAETLVHLWVLAGRLGVPACQNECIVALEMARRESSVIETGALDWVYENTGEYDEGACGLRNLLVEQCAWLLDDEWITDTDEGTLNADSFPRQALIDMITTMKRMFGLSRAEKGFKPDFLWLPERRGAYWVEE